MKSIPIIIDCDPGVDDAVALFKELIPPTRAEPGCRMYVVHRSTTDPRRFFLYEQYDDLAALDAHRASPHFSLYVTGGLLQLLESRTPEMYEPLVP